MIGSPPLWPKNLLENFTFDTVVDTVEKLFCAHQLAWLAKRNAHFFTEQLLCGYAPSRHRLYAKCTLLVIFRTYYFNFPFEMVKRGFHTKNKENSGKNSPKISYWKKAWVKRNQNWKRLTSCLVLNWDDLARSSDKK